MLDFPLGMGARRGVAATPASLERLSSGSVRVNSLPTVPSLQLTRLGSGNVQVESA